MEEKKLIDSITYTLVKPIILSISALMLLVGVIAFLFGLFNPVPYGFYNDAWTVVGCAAVLTVLSLVAYWWLSSCSLSITNKRAFGKGAFGKRVDLPMDSISAVALCWLKGISISTSSGRISFLLIKNQKEVYDILNNLLIERQSKSAKDSVVINQSNADELKKFKELLDSGVITQEEFDAKKKQLLGL